MARILFYVIVCVSFIGCTSGKKTNVNIIPRPLECFVDGHKTMKVAFDVFEGNEINDILKVTLDTVADDL